MEKTAFLNDPYEIARGLISKELDEFDNNPFGFIQSMAWDKKAFPKLLLLKDELSFTVEDINKVKDIINNELSKMPFDENVTETTLTIMENNKINDCLTNLIAGKIIKAYKKLNFK